MRQIAALEVGADLALNESGRGCAGRSRSGTEGLELVADNGVEEGASRARDVRTG
jgi:hypothetical protein